MVRCGIGLVLNILRLTQHSWLGDLQATKGQQVKVFYTMPEYEAWKEETANLRGWKIKYYKGLGTSTSKEAKEYFAALTTHRKTFVWTGMSLHQVTKEV